MGQVADGVDEFYKDFRNKLIGVVFALDYVRDQLKGKSPDELGQAGVESVSWSSRPKVRSAH